MNAGTSFPSGTRFRLPGRRAYQPGLTGADDETSLRAHRGAGAPTVRQGGQEAAARAWRRGSPGLSVDSADKSEEPQGGIWFRRRRKRECRWRVREVKNARSRYKGVRPASVIK